MITFDDAYDYIKNTAADNVEQLFYYALLENKVNFNNLSCRYVDFLKYEKEKNLDQLVEAETCVLESLIFDKIGKSKVANKSIQRRLYLLNTSNRLNCCSLNDKWGYIGNEAAKELSYYERMKKDY